MYGMQGLMVTIGSVTMQFWGVGLMFAVVMAILLMQLPSLFIRLMIFCVMAFWGTSVYMYMHQLI